MMGSKEGVLKKNGAVFLCWEEEMKGNEVIEHA
jgi:hypothetical protein